MMNRLFSLPIAFLIGLWMLGFAPMASAVEVLFANYFDIKTGSPAGTEVTGKVNLLRNKDAHLTPVPANFSFSITSDPSGIFEIVDQHDSESRLFGMLKVKAGQSIAATPVDYPVTVSLSQGGATLATASITVHALAQTQHEKMFAHAKTYCVAQDRLFARSRFNDATITSMLDELEANGGRFNGFDFYTRPISDYVNTSGQANNLSDQWQAVVAKIGGLGFAYQNTDTRWSTLYGPNGMPANRLRLKNALYAALREYLNRVPIDPAEVVINGQPIGSDFGDGVMRLVGKGILNYNDTTHSWIWTDGVTGPTVWILPDLLADIGAGNLAAKELHENLIRFFQICYGLPLDNRNVNDPGARWGDLTDTNHTEGAFADANHFHRMRGWLPLPTIWSDYNRPLTYVPYWYDGYFSSFPGFQLRPGWTPHGSLDDYVFWVRSMLVPTHQYPQSGFHPDGMITHHFAGGTDGRAMWAYGYEWLVAPIESYALLKNLGINPGDEGFNQIVETYLYTYDKLIYRGEVDATLLGRNYAANAAQWTNGFPATINQLIAAKQPATQITREPELLAWRTALQSGTQQATGNFPFWIGNYMMHRKGGQTGDNNSYALSVTMGNDVMGATDDFDVVAKIFHASSGVMFTKVTGTEYAMDVRSRWDWHALPGLTEEWRTDAMPGGSSASQFSGSAYAGVASDGTRGFAAMRYRPANGQTYATARADKAWFFPGDEVVALGSEVARRATGQGNAIITTIDQTRWAGDLKYSVNGAAVITIAQGATVDQSISLTGPTWLHQGSVGYFVIPQGTQALRLRGGSAVIDTDPASTSTVSVIHLAIDHGANPSAEKYRYFIVPNITAAEMPARLAALQTRIEVIGNGDNIQGIYDHDGQTLQVAFHAAGSATVSNSMTVAVDRPALVQLHRNGANWHVAASDPIHEFAATELNITVKAPLKSGTYTHTLPGIIPRAGKPVSVTHAPGGIAKIHVPLPDVTDGPNLDYQEELYANVPIRAIVPVNTPPPVADDTASTAEDTPITIDVLANDNAGLTIGELTQGAHGATAVVNGKVVYTPELDFNGTDSFTYTAVDASGNSAAATVSITITAVDDAPMFVVDPVIKPAAQVAIAYSGQTLAGSAIDPDAGDPVTFSKISGPAWLEVAPDGALSGTPTGSAGVNLWTVRATDTLGAFDEATLRINIEDPDSDGDGVLNSVELAAGTNPQVGDTDGDGFSDGYEISRNTNPTDSNSKPTSYAAALWDFNTATAAQVYDRIGAVAGTLMAGAACGADASGRTGLPGDRALELDAANERVDVTDIAFLRNAAANNDLTISFWQKLNPAASWNLSAFWAYSPTAAGNRGIQAHTPSGTTIYFDYGGASGVNRQQVATPPNVTWTNWNHIALVRRTGGVSEIWVNGAKIATASGKAMLPTDFTALNIGSGLNGASNIRGRLDDFAVFHTALADSEIQALAAGAMPDQFPSPYQSWRAFHFTPAQLGAPLISGDDADPDFDGRSNLLEWALNTNPNTPNGGGYQYDFVEVNDTDFLRLTVRKNPAATDLFYQAEVTSDLSLPATWSRNDVVVESNTAHTLIVRDKIGGPVRFIRLKVSRTPSS